MHFSALYLYRFISFLLDRIPRDRAIAAQWSVALGFGAEKILHGFVCFEHFEEYHFKKKNKTGLKPHAVPKVSINSQSDSIQKNPNDNINVSAEILEENDQCSINDIELSSSQTGDTLDVSIEADAYVEVLRATTTGITECHPANKSTILTDNSANSHLHLLTNCENCVKKDYLISTRDDTIKELRKKLQKANSKIWYLETVKRKLSKTLSELKQQELLDEEAFEALQVKKHI